MMEKTVTINMSYTKTPAKIPWSKSELEECLRFLPLIWAHSNSLQRLAPGLWVRQCVWNLQTQSRICLCKSMWRWKKGSKMFSHVPSSASPIYGTWGLLAPCLWPQSRTVAWGKIKQLCRWSLAVSNVIAVLLPYDFCKAANMWMNTSPLHSIIPFWLSNNSKQQGFSSLSGAPTVNYCMNLSPLSLCEQHEEVWIDFTTQ